MTATAVDVGALTARPPAGLDGCLPVRARAGPPHWNVQDSINGSATPARLPSVAGTTASAPKA